MKNKIMVFISMLIVVSLISSCGNDDDNTNITPSLPFESVASIKYKDVKLATREINTEVQVAMSSLANKTGLNSKNVFNDCITISSALTENGVTATLDYGDNCKSPCEKDISGKIILKYNINENSKNF